MLNNSARVVLAALALAAVDCICEHPWVR